MQRDWHLPIGLGEKLGTSAPHPMRERRGKMQAVTVLKRQYQGAARIVVAHRGARAIEQRRGGKARTAEATWTDIEIEGIAALGAARRAEKGDAAPAFRAQRAAGNARLAAGEAARREQQIEQPVADAAEPDRLSEAGHARIVIRRG